jgi:hypothetical protein
MKNAKLAFAGKAIKVGGYALAERVRPPVPLTRDDVPISGAHVTPQWLTEVLCRDAPGARVESFSNPGGSSGTSERVALRVSYNKAGRDAGLPIDLFTKSTASYSQRMTLGGAGVLEGETSFYMTLRAKTTMEAPKGYWGRADPHAWRSIAIMEDIVATKGARFVDATEPLSHEQVRDLVQNLARYHGELWASPALSGLSTPRTYIERTQAFLDIRKRCEVGMRRARAEIPTGLLGQEDRLFDATIRAMRIAGDEMPRTLLHGDAHVGQTYVTADGRMGLADWQGAQQGGWAFDYCYLVNSACEPEDRRRWERGLLELYIERLLEHGGPRLSFEDAWLAYRQQSFWPYTAWAFTIGRAWYQPKMQPVPACLAIIRRTAAAIDDLDAFAAVGL